MKSQNEQEAPSLQPTVGPAANRVVDFAAGDNAEYLAERYQQYLSDPASLDETWQAFFAGFSMRGGEGGDVELQSADVRDVDLPGQPEEAEVAKAIGIYDLVHSYREFGHFEAHLNPLESPDERPGHPMLSLENFELDGVDMKTYVGKGGFCGETDGTLGDLIAKLRQTYCGTIGVEFTGVADREQRRWLQEQMEPALNRPNLDAEQKKHVLRQLVQAEEFEQFLHKAFVGAKRFSLEGGESLVPLLNGVVEQSGPLGGEQVICSMAHRGRLNVLAHVLRKPYETMLAEFAGTITKSEDEAADYGDGDVKYHLGFANTRRVKPDSGGDYHDVKVSLLPNPSHLELINPIQQGIVRCKQRWLLDGDREKVVPVCLHGDAAFVGQGIVFETLNLSELLGYRTGGTIHVIVNNQIGFTTPPKQGRFTPYPTDVAKSIQAPVFHVNGDDPEAVYHVTKLAVAFRQRFKQDVLIDLWCYRKYGHNEADEPSFTQPLMYAKIRKHKGVRTLYASQLLKEGVVDKAALEAMKDDVLSTLKESREAARVEKYRGKTPSFSGVWRGMGRAPTDYTQWGVDTTVDREVLRTVVGSVNRIPDSFSVHPKLSKLLEARVEAVESGENIDWGTGEMLAIGSLLLGGASVRLTGQDVERGTFSHRHAVLHDVENGKRYRPLQYVGGGARHENQGRFEIINTMLSEEAVLGFEWGFASADPRNLVIWEAQFGDFVNGAQNIIDQIIAAAESKWGYMNGLVMNLPHGYEGMGPEHSNAYLERFLSLAAEHNLQVAVPTTPAQYFHLLRRQILRKFRKPLIIMSPKSLLRKPEAASSIGDFTDSGLSLVIDDVKVSKPESVRRVLLCSGKAFYTLDAARDEAGAEDVAVVRVEQLYPWPKHEIRKAVKRYAKAGELIWCQEEPANRGAWSFAQPRLRGMFPDRLVGYVGREASASPAVGSAKAHAAEEKRFVREAMTIDGNGHAIAQMAKEQTV